MCTVMTYLFGICLRGVKRAALNVLCPFQNGRQCLNKATKLSYSQQSKGKGKGKGKCKCKAVPLQAWIYPEGSRKLRFPDFMTTAQDGGKVVSLTHQPPLPPGNIPGTHF